jgi:hypothetical protein
MDEGKDFHTVEASFRRSGLAEASESSSGRENFSPIRL